MPYGNGFNGSFLSTKATKTKKARATGFCVRRTTGRYAYDEAAEVRPPRSAVMRSR